MQPISFTSTPKKQNAEFVRVLPVPEIHEETELQYSFKQPQSGRNNIKIKPPKLNRYTYDQLLKNQSNTAHMISFRSIDDTELITVENISPSFCYDNKNSSTYFEQCFVSLGKLGEGSFGEVFKVRSKEDGLLYAVKMSKQIYRNQHYRKERLEEVRRYEQFSDHENCIRFYRAWEQKEKLYMQMELCRESLEQHLQLHNFVPEQRIWSILLDLLLALKSLHDRNLIHLDIKLDNILIGDDNTCKLADFGLVIDVDKANRQQATEGDSRYMAPEIMKGNFSKAADVFSLGIAMLELTCNLVLPSNGPLWRKLRNGNLPEEFSKKVSFELQNIIRSMMIPDADLRPTVDQLLEHKRLKSLKAQRQRWAVLKKIRHIIRESHRTFKSVICYVKNIILQKFRQLRDSRQRKLVSTSKNIQSISIKKTPSPNMRSQLFSSTPVSSKLRFRSFKQLLNNSDNFKEFESHCVLNTTSSNLLSQINCRSRRNLSREMGSLNSTNSSDFNSQCSEKDNFQEYENQYVLNTTSPNLLPEINCRSRRNLSREMGSLNSTNSSDFNGHCVEKNELEHNSSPPWCKRLFDDVDD